MGRLFGTDGVRGVANTELSCELALKLGRAAAMVLTEETHHRPQIIIGKDTRISSDMLEAAMTAGICSVGANVLVLGVVPTPAVAYLVKKLGADAGVMISASHNPAQYNGIKIFSGSGYKLSDSLEEKIEAIVLDGLEEPPIKAGDGVGRVIKPKTAIADYINYLKSTINTDLSGLRIAVDCANGSASVTAPLLFKELGADCEIINANPDGLNINDGCGSTHIEMLSEYVKGNGFDIGVAFDGDADRCLAVDEDGNLIDGDKLIAIFSASLKEKGRLKSNTAVVTVMSNLGFFKFAESHGINAARTKVGDRYVLEEMINGGYVLGGEQSGHIIFLDHATTGDGELSALQLLAILKNSGKKASELASIIECYPQVMVNVKVGSSNNKDIIMKAQDVADAIKKAELKLADEGRIVVRPSGTEPLIRVMVEGKDRDEITKLADDVADVIRSHVG
ncbi:MAG: phosphoglucosamine mutase [[Clostridium] cellulosi]